MSIKEDCDRTFRVSEEGIDRIIEYKKREELKRKIRDALMGISNEEILEWKEKAKDSKSKRMIKFVEKMRDENDIK